MNVVVIDDEEPIAQLLEDALAGAGHSVEVAGSGRDPAWMASVSKPGVSGWTMS